MKDCFSEDTLIARYFGETSDSGASHLKTCAVCARRYRGLRRDMEVINGALRATPIGGVVHRWRFARRLIAGALAAAIAVFAVGWFTRSRMPVPVSQTSVVTRQAAVLSKPQILVSRLVPTATGREVNPAAPVPVSYLTYLREAFADEDGCEQGDATFNPSCSQGSQ